MNTAKEERRRCERIFFSDTDGIIGVFSLPNQHNRAITAHIMDLSEEGLGLSLDQNDEGEQLVEEDHLIIIKVKGLKDSELLNDIELEVKWTLNVKHIFAGCEFLNVSLNFREQLRELMNLWSD